MQKETDSKNLQTHTVIYLTVSIFASFELGYELKTYELENCIAELASLVIAVRTLKIQQLWICLLGTRAVDCGSRCNCDANLKQNQTRLRNCALTNKLRSPALQLWYYYHNIIA